ncbi:OsmC family protein [Mycoplasma phocoenae]|uniref:OsmC family protein n=1 Tax=Mycoplasma phocoenae TaxID=754517 RepID=A0A858U8D2_9MOLU|nr:OsmC family protein [Mycoplasma phocoenae]QJG66976.1 OsmC family protein [Mycoplasma phocoenae]
MKQYKIRTIYDFDKKIDVTKTKDGFKIILDTNNIVFANPIETYLACIAACEKAFINTYAKEQKIKIESLIITINASRDPGSNKYVGMKDFKFEYDITADCTHEQMSTIIEKTIEKCPIYQTIDKSVNILHELNFIQK